MGRILYNRSAILHPQYIFEKKEKRKSFNLSIYVASSF